MLAVLQAPMPNAPSICTYPIMAKASPKILSNFAMLKPWEEQLWRLGALAERYFADDPNTSLLKSRQFAELLAQSLAARSGRYTSQSETQYELVRRLSDEGIVPPAVKLDALLMQVDACRNRLDKIPGIIKRFRQAVLLKAISSELTSA